jgi:tripartite-type tricarboxylate transporter receptor subunit TctC
MRRRALLLALATPALAPALGGAAEGWPVDRVTFITSLPAGSSVDVTTRLFADRLAKLWGRAVVVDNRGGANGVLACQAVARAKPDGLTLLSTSAMTHAANPWLIDKLPYDPIADFEAVTRFGNSPFVIMANKRLGVATLAELIGRLKAQPGGLNFGWGAVPARVAAELFLQAAGASATQIGYRGNQAAFPDLLEGRLSFQVIDVVGGKPLIDRGEVLALALSADRRHPGLPAVPNAAEAGLPAFRFTTWSGVYAPRGTPAEIVARIQADFAAAFADPALAARFAELGGAPEPPASPADFAAFTRAELPRWGEIIRGAGMRLD